MHWGAPEMLVWLWVLPAVAALGVYMIARRRAMLKRFASSALWSAVAPHRASRSRSLLKWSLCVLALGSLIVALARPQWNAPGQEPKKQEVKRMGRDVCFLIDVSRSMLAEDMAPSRLERAKLWVKDVLEVVRGDRVAVVAFAGQGVVKCPLTHDYAFVRMAVEELSPDSVTRGGTNIGDAIRLAISEVFDEKTTSHKDIILISDGEDQDSAPVEAARAAAEKGVRIIAVGIGDEHNGARIPVKDEQDRRTFLTYQGKEVFSKLSASTLREVALATPGGQYFDVGTGNIELDRVYKSLISQAEKTELGSAEAEARYEDRFQWALAAALVLLVLEMLLTEARRPARA